MSGLEKTEPITNLVPGVGPVPCAGMIIGEAPGAEEEKQGVPFVGASGYLLDESLRAVGLDRQELYVTNVYKKRPPENRDPTAEEIESHKELLDVEFEEVAPTTILLLGRVARDTLIPRLKAESMGNVRGRIYSSPNDRHVVVTWHPAYILYSGGRGSEAYTQFLEDLTTFKGLVDESS